MTAEEFTQNHRRAAVPRRITTLETNLETGLGANSLDKVQLMIAFEGAYWTSKYTTQK